MNTRVSVCMATYNGDAYIDEQIRSVLAQLGPDDELVIVDDCSNDDTIARIEAWRDPRIRLLRNDVNVGYVAAFERALRSAHGEILFLCDQDDVWPAGRVTLMTCALEQGSSVVAGNLSTLDGADRISGPFGQPDWRLRSGDSGRTARSLLLLAASNAPYFGSAIALRREVLAFALPFPWCVRELHDVWLVLIGIFGRTLVHVDDRVVLRRFHDSNVSGHIRSPVLVLRGRLYFLGMCVVAWRRTRPARRLRIHSHG